jgi:zinc transport system permease protein
VLVSRAHGMNSSILTYLFGQPLTASASEVRVIVWLGVLITVAMLALRRVLFAVVTDEEWARVAGLPSTLVSNLLAVLTACAVVAAMKIVGILLVAAMMVLPVASGQLIARSFAGTLRWSIGVSVAAVVAGLMASRWWNLAPAGIIVLITAAVFAVLAVATGGTGRTAMAAEEVDV